MSISIDAPPPSDLEAERVIIGMCMAPDMGSLALAIPGMEVAETITPVETIAHISGLVRPDQFWDEFNRDAYTAILSLWEAGREVNTVTVNHEIQKMWARPSYRGGKHPTPMAELASMSTFVTFSPGAAERWANDIIAAWEKRNLIEQATHIIEEALVPGGQSASTISVNAIGRMMLDVENASDTASLGEVLIKEGLAGRILERLMDPTAIHGVRTGWAMLDIALGGLAPQQVTTVLADTGSGKSWFVHWLAWMCARQGHRPLIISTEMSKDEVTQRIAFMHAGLDWYAIKKRREATEEEVMRVSRALEEVAAIPIRVREGAKMEITAVAQEIRRQQLTNNVDVVFIDHIQHLRVKGIPEHQTTATVSAVMASMKAIAQSTNLPIVQVSHIGRTEVGSPGLHSGKGSSSIEQDSDAVVTLAAVYHDSTNWVPFESKSAFEDYRDRHNKVPVKIAWEKSRSGGNPSEIRFLDWNQGGKYVEVAR